MNDDLIDWTASPMLDLKVCVFEIDQIVEQTNPGHDYNGRRYISVVLS